MKEFVISHEYDERIQEIAVALLSHIVNEHECITYGELVLKLSFDISPRNVEKPLGVISYICKDNGLPPVSVMVVNKETLMPGIGFFKAYFPQLRTEDERLARCFETMNEVKKYKHWEEVLEAFKNWS